MTQLYQRRWVKSRRMGGSAEKFRKCVQNAEAKTTEPPIQGERAGIGALLPAGMRLDWKITNNNERIVHKQHDEAFFSAEQGCRPAAKQRAEGSVRPPRSEGAGGREARGPLDPDLHQKTRPLARRRRAPIRCERSRIVVARQTVSADRPRKRLRQRR